MENQDQLEQIVINFLHQKTIPTKTSIWGQQIPWSDNVGYLGLAFDRRLAFASHVKNTLIKCDKLSRMLYPLIKRRSQLDRKSEMLPYKMLFPPSITYGCALKYRKKLQVKQNRILEMILNLDPFYSTEDVHRLAKMEIIDDWIQRVLPKFWVRCSISANSLLEQLVRRLWY